MPDYTQLLDAEIQAFLARSAAYYPPDAVSLSVAEQRKVYDALCAGFESGRPESVVVRDRRFGGVPCRVYEVPEAGGTILYAHGGGFVVGGLESHDSICADFAAASGLRLVAVDYRLSPEHPHPADFEDISAAFHGISDEYGGPLVLAGDSAGGNLVAALAHARRGEPQIAGVLLIYPGLGGGGDLRSYVEHADAPGLTRADIAYYHTIRSAGQDKSADPTFAPLADRDFSQLPPVVAVTAECDPLSSDGDVYVQKLRAAGGDGLWRKEAGLVHGYLRARNMSAKAKQSFDWMAAALKTLSHGALPLE